MTRRISTSSFTSQNLSSSTLVGTYTASADQELTVRLFAGKILGGSTYIAQLYLLPSGCSNYFPTVPYTSASVDSSASRLSMLTIPFKMANGDAVRVYLTGACADTASPFVTTEIWEQWGSSALSASNISGSALDNTVFKANAIGIGVLAASVLAASNIGGSAFNSTVFAGSVMDNSLFAANSGSVIWNAAVRSLTDKSAFAIAQGGIGVGSFAASAIAASAFSGSAIDNTVINTAARSGYSLAAGQISVKKNTALSGFPFVMTDSTLHQPKTLLTVAGTRSIDGAAFASTASAPTELANGWYLVNLAAADLNGTTIALRFTAASADDLNITLLTQA